MVGFDATAADRLQAMDHHFWTRGRQALVAGLLDRLHGARGSAVDLGCGTGVHLDALAARFQTVTGIDTHQMLLDHARQRNANTELRLGDATATGLPDGCADLVLALDVIEHLDPDALLVEVRRLLVPGGCLLLSAPASPALWSSMDEAAGHRCRYTTRQMAAELIRNGFTVLGSTHYQALLYPLAALSKVLGRRSDQDFERRPPVWLDRCLGAVNALERPLALGPGLPFGTSLFMWAAS